MCFFFFFLIRVFVFEQEFVAVLQVGLRFCCQEQDSTDASRAEALGVTLFVSGNRTAQTRSLENLPLDSYLVGACGTS